jgi:predicted nucleotidyltransferase
LALFGSVGRDAAQPDSDVDLLVEFVPGHKTFDRFMALADLLEQILNRRVELVTPESLSPFLKPYILASARDVVRAA